MVCHTSATEVCRTFNICFVRTGYFEYQVFRKDHEVHVGRVLISKPEFEHVARHIDNQPDICSVFDFTADFYRQLEEHYPQATWFFRNNDIHALLLQTNPQIEYLHNRVLNKLFYSTSDHLLMDDLVMRMVELIMQLMLNTKEPREIPDNLKKFHLATVEKAKLFLLQNFDKNIGLQSLADHCCVSLFHFSRIFKSILNVSPHQFLQQVRLNHANILLETTGLPVSQISDQCGFNSLEYFATAYKQRFKTTPSSFREKSLLHA
jgi:AraC-like DNA-binding protein